MIVDFFVIANEITPSKLLENNIKVKEKFYVVFVHSLRFQREHLETTLKSKKELSKGIHFKVN
jgi:hypothetical protein